MQTGLQLIENSVRDKMETKEHIVKQDYSELDRAEVLEVLFCPRKESKDEVIDERRIDADIDVGDGLTVGARFHLAEANDGPSLLMFHGNGETAADYDIIAPEYTNRGINFIIADYRGYGWSGGEPTVTSMIRDSYKVKEYVKAVLADKGKTGKFAIMGRSLGSSPALEQALFDSTVDGLIIESGFAHTRPVLSTLGIDVEALAITEEKGFGNLVKIKNYMRPVLIIHGAKDEIIAASEAGELHAECCAGSKELQIVPGADHNTIISVGGHLYFDLIDRFLRKLGQPRRRKKPGIR